jgi:RNA polymerase sigma-70 factor (ECF subfamily)
MAEFYDPKSLNNEDSLESLLDEESDEEFGLPKFQEHFADSLTPAVLKDWSAKDFASIYVRFRPHLERHAKRFLNNSSQVEEVVQDAFLYLMTTLPDLDSELGVLRFLKWKTRLLALDVIRANSRVSLAPLDEHGEFEANIPEISQDLERADDAAIVSLALAKLQPRHREALIATLYEEKSKQVVSAQMGLSENAFRQLLFRSRSAFKKALIGEAETAGLSMSGILSLAARKAAADSGKIASVAGAFLLVLAVSIGVIPNLSLDSSEQVLSLQSTADVPTTSFPEVESDSALAGKGNPSVDISERDTVVDDSDAPVRSDSQGELIRDGNLDQVSLDSESSILPVDENFPEIIPASNDAETVSAPSLMEISLLKTLGPDATTLLSGQKSSSLRLIQPSLGMTTVRIDNGAGLAAVVSYDVSLNQPIQRVWFELSVGAENFISAPLAWAATKKLNQDGTITLDFAATDLLIGDVEGLYDFTAVDDADLSRSAVEIVLILTPGGIPTSQELVLTSRS